MIIIKNKFIPFGDYTMMNLFGIFLITKIDEISHKDYNHERIHSIQIWEMFIIGFYLWYLIEYLIIRFYHKKQSDAYHDVSFEEEAHNNDDNLDYLKSRKVFQYKWIKYTKFKSN